MAHMWRRAMVYLGLQDDEEYGYDQYGGYDAPDDNGYPAVPGDDQYGRGAEPAEVAPRGRPDPYARDVRPLRDVHATPRDYGVPSREGFGEPTVRAVPRDDQPSGVLASRPAVVRAVPTSAAKVHVVEPHGFNDAPEIGDRVRDNQAVILNLQDADAALRRRLIDFSSGLAYAVGGAMSRVAEYVFLITPMNVQLSQEEKERLQARGLYRGD